MIEISRPSEDQFSHHSAQDITSTSPEPEFDQCKLLPLPSEEKYSSPKNHAKARSIKTFLIHFLRIFAAIIIFGLLDQQWTACFASNPSEITCTQHCTGTKCRLPCYFGGQGTLTACDYNNTSGEYDRACYTYSSSTALFSISCPFDGSLCFIEANSNCACRNWVYFSAIAISLHVFDILLQILVLSLRHYDVNYLQYHWVVVWNWKRLFNPWNCWVGWYDYSCLIAIGFLQALALNFAMPIQCQDSVRFFSFSL
jgi:hypothetical protein